MTPTAIDDPSAGLTGQLAQLLQSRGLMLCTAESCTGGLIAAACTERAGSSLWFERGFVSYSNASKTDLLGVPPDLIARHGAVSQEVARAMAAGALAHARAELAVAVTGVAGPGGGSADKPVGTVWLAWALGSQVRTELRHFEGDRSAVRQATVARALQGLIEMLQTSQAV
jgi:nicotinamide-nucleotide amidase